MKMLDLGTFQNFNFDYVGVPNHQRWMNNGKFDGGLLTDKEKSFETSIKDYSIFHQQFSINGRI
jgi:hypothetical protein